MPTPSFQKRLNKLLRPLQSDDRIGPAHISVYLALLQSSKPRQSWIPLNRPLLMRLARLKGRNTYHKILRDLSQLGYITYLPSKYPPTKSRAKLAQ